ncbi:preprotein translocase subunit SecE [Allostreptomyces psammosilenae]|uniref:preprotein translocase subunit SecE n=1 Tax=Allostreptomyces psammosilenae TaxID=1892865 RepID=UPI0028A6AFA8|nr:preprotein translocase subunit SecE [Allostreptomyces psammosilenae]
MTETMGSTATPEREPEKKRQRERRPGLFARLRLFLRQIVAELRKVVWPTRNQLVTYTTVVIVFVLIVLAIVSVLDWVFSRGVFAIFG